MENNRAWGCPTCGDTGKLIRVDYQDSPKGEWFPWCEGAGRHPEIFAMKPCPTCTSHFKSLDEAVAVAVAGAIEQEFPSVFSLESYEQTAESFHKDTGMMAPGKSACFESPTIEEREAKWAVWMKYRRNIRTRMLDAIRTPATNTKQEG